MSDAQAQAMTIDLKLVRIALQEALALVDQLDGAELDERSAWAENNKRRREEKLAKSKTLQIIAHRCATAEQLVHNEYWISRGVADILDGDRG